jgi:hypothetical protein
MTDLNKFRQLPKRYQCLVAIAVLLDGIDAATYLENDEHYGKDLQIISSSIGKLEPSLRMPLMGTILREIVAEAI